MNPAIADITCPHCQNDKATVHREKLGKVKALYYRCPTCGTIQPRYATGQEFINKNARFYDVGNLDAREKAGEQAAAEAKAEVAEAAHRAAKEKAKEVPAPEIKPAPEKSKSVWTMF